ncbi:acyloxyacyl hydrolase [Lampropedia aestuarii]|uniref:acyloxyacyl hydrolase n=1 Tax=Lampropedia aestuarii TaxID=2562762 RepID=UPI0024689563|nr:acyloxyacyl hydrolase [Lampropedia aestuarii]MDH5858435.1 acyloxyacyl hydrolase [Lampropedia aestuarii]
MVKKYFSTIFFAIALLSFSPFLYAWDLAVSVGRTGQTQTTYRVGAFQDWSSRWLESSTGYVSGFWDIGLTRWQAGDLGQTSYSLSLSPVFVYQFKRSGSLQPFFEAGIGAAAFSKTRVGDKQLGGSLNFEDRLGVGFDYGKHRFGFRVLDYSNAGISKPNEGVESYSLYYSYRFD